MTKSELIKNLASRMDLPPKEAEVAVNTVLEALRNSLSRGDRVELRGFGSLGIKHHRAREGRNPKTGVSVQVAAKRLVFFKAGKELRERVDHD
ncbi:MAG: integration host factor subunit beta [Magnetococcales bacterium]|nr:integration host factor subunit beta [Magnetococcales bacterium]